MRSWAHVLLGLSICLTSAPSCVAEALDGGAWRWEDLIDPITDEVRRTAVVHSRIDMTGQSPMAFVSLHCINQTPAIYVGWSANVIARGNWLLEYRFAGHAGHPLNARYVNRSHQIIADVDDIRGFLGEAVDSDTLNVRVTSNAYGTSDATFSTRRGSETVARIVADCPDAVPR